MAQTVSGKLTSEEEPVEFAEIKNLTKNKKSYSRSDGIFKIEADLRDTLVIEALFYEPQTIVVDSLAYRENYQIQLQKREFNLEEVLITTEKYTFDPEEYSGNLNQQIKTDYERYPFLYRPNRGNITELASYAITGVKKLFGIEKKEVDVVTYISFEDLEKLFAEDEFFNDDLLLETMRISSDNKFSFFAFCEDQKIESRLLESENNFLLLDELVVLAGDFRKRSEETEGDH